MRLSTLLLTAGAAVSLSACAYGPYGGYGVYGNYGYGSPYYGYGAGYGSPYYGYGAGYGSPYYGWYDDYYYPGTGIYVYDSYRRPHVWTDRQRHHWQKRRETYVSRQATHSTGRAVVRERSLGENWSDFDRRSERMESRQDRRRTRDNDR